MAGAYGSFLADLLVANPKSTGVRFDQPQVSLNERGTPCAAVSIASPPLPHLAPESSALWDVVISTLSSILTLQLQLDVMICTVARQTNTAARFPNMRSVQVIARAKKLWQEEGKKASVLRRTTFASGDFFKPGGLTSLCTLTPAARDRTCIHAHPKLWGRTCHREAALQEVMPVL